MLRNKQNPWQERKITGAHFSRWLGKGSLGQRSSQCKALKSEVGGLEFSGAVSGVSEGRGERGEAGETCRGLTSQAFVGGGCKSGFYCRYEPVSFYQGVTFKTHPDCPVETKRGGFKAQAPGVPQEC